MTYSCTSIYNLEGHLILGPSQLKEEFKGCLELAKFAEKIGLAEDVSYRFSKWDETRTDKYEGTKEQWDKAQDLMGEILDELELDYEVGIDEVVFPYLKLDIQIKMFMVKKIHLSLFKLICY